MARTQQRRQDSSTTQRPRVNLSEPLLPRLDPQMDRGVNLYGRYSVVAKKTRKGDDRSYLYYAWNSRSRRVAGSFYYVDSDGSYFYNNPDGSKYYNPGYGGGWYSPPLPKLRSFENQVVKRRVAELAGALMGTVPVAAARADDGGDTEKEENVKEEDVSVKEVTLVKQEMDKKEQEKEEELTNAHMVIAIKKEDVTSVKLEEMEEVKVKCEDA